MPRGPVPGAPTPSNGSGGTRPQACCCTAAGPVRHARDRACQSCCHERYRPRSWRGPSTPASDDGTPAAREKHNSSVEAARGLARRLQGTPRASARRRNQPGRMAEQHQHEQKERRVGKVLDQAVQRQQEQIADQAAKHASRLPSCRIGGRAPEMGGPGRRHSTTIVVEILRAVKHAHAELMRPLAGCAARAGRPPASDPGSSASAQVLYLRERLGSGPHVVKPGIGAVD